MENKILIPGLVALVLAGAGYRLYTTNQIPVTPSPEITENGETLFPEGSTTLSGTSSENSGTTEDGKVPVRPTTSAAEMKTYQQIMLAYEVKYPENWEIKDESKTLLFFGPKDENGYGPTINVQKMFHKNDGGKYENIDGIVADFKSQLTSLDGFSISDEKELDISGHAGKSYKANFTYGTIPYSQWQVVFANQDGTAFFSWAYTAPAGTYENYLPEAQASLDGFKITEGVTTPLPIIEMDQNGNVIN